MSRIGKQPVAVPDGVTVAVNNGSVNVKGPKGDLTFAPHPNMTVTLADDGKSVSVSRPNDQAQNRALHGLTRSLIDNMVTGVKEPFERKLEIRGVGYNARLNGSTLSLQVGFANTIMLTVPDGVECTLPDQTHVIVRSPDKQKCGQFAANVRKVRPPEPYKGKGIRYDGEQVKQKAGKAFGSGGK
ncbi:50S ribosomal protein L6 [Alienimonas californiensis]|uniref:Large ribosomal subunit protein uL6 n=1 Tax=Alienimonas californiensis TaxID=2527989 RepID=A0A517P9L1_9PLAN|nr:50S ribosomal protein L6 [Alienimonas californiensis]QDT16045.1 50S ribosomal protein L6 [Alienimonas californiensis]